MSYSYPDKQVLKDSLSNLADLIRLGRSKGTLKWVNGDIITSPAAGSSLVYESCIAYTDGGGIKITGVSVDGEGSGGGGVVYLCREIYIYGFMITSDEANSYLLTYTRPDGSSMSIRITAPSGGTLYLTDYVPLNEGDPAIDVGISVENNGSGRYQARLLVLEVQ